MYENAIIPLIFRSDDDKLFYEFVLNGQSASIEYRFVNKNQLMLLNINKSKYLAEEVILALIERIMVHARRMDYEVYTQNPSIMKHLKSNKLLQNSIRTSPRTEVSKQNFN
ncbi:hypothetical protein J0X14_08075 [Muricauda sp. CAU 1633]|uniref:hypothetical protein n=1 Tax=Allomuricauda sp. CAU 1633 TaxID=2816036 RepID=UPI001A8C87C3|nr:hypothetical protein [Muricauda sp. CAU 1633]MBO0322248.1 hypothetical protein [Muricauda sp. CAU 1633]